MRRPVQRRRAIALRKIHIGFLRDQRENSRTIAFLGCIRDVAGALPEINGGDRGQTHRNADHR